MDEEYDMNEPLPQYLMDAIEVAVMFADNGIDFG